MFELPDDVGDELEFSMDDEIGADDAGLPDDLELPDGDADDFEMLDDLDDAVEMSPPDDDDRDIPRTEIITPNSDATEVVEGGLEPDVDADDDISAIDLGMEDTALKNVDDHIEETGELVLDVEDDEEDVSIIDFGVDEFVNPTEMIRAVSRSDVDGDDDDFVLDDEVGEELITGTFAPGDFDEPTAGVDSMANLDDLDDLMLPDDVDEVSTKLDLARAFIDMGDTEGARGSLEEVMSEGNADQKAEAKTLLDQI